MNEHERGGVGVYECPNGHRYTVGECTRTRGKATCPDCGASIGNDPNKGMHNMASGNKLIGNSKGSQWGDSNEKNLSEQDL